MAGNLKVRMYDLQNRYKFKVFCSGTPYDDSEIKQDISNLQSNKANKSDVYTKQEAKLLSKFKSLKSPAISLTYSLYNSTDSAYWSEFIIALSLFLLLLSSGTLEKLLIP